LRPWAIGLLLVLCAATVAAGLTALNRTGYANGWDGYYYLVQIKSLHTTGTMHSREYSAVYLPLMAMHALTGDYLSASKLSAVLIKTVFVLSVFALAYSLSGGRTGGDGRTSFHTALIAASLSAMSPSLNYFFTQFPKNLLGFALFFFFAALLPDARRLQERHGRVRAAWAALLFVAAFFTHRFTAVLSLLFLAGLYAPPALFWIKRMLRGGGKSAKPMMQWWLWLAPVALILITLLVSQKLPLALSSHDLELVTGELSSRPIIVPITFLRCFGASRTTLPWRMEIIAGGVIPIVTGILLLWGKAFRSIRPKGRYPILLMMSLIGLLPFLKFSPMSLSYRLFFGTMLMLPIVVLPYTRLIVGAITKFRATAPVLLFTALLILSPFTGDSYDPELHDPPYAFYEQVALRCAQVLEDRDFVLVIAHKALAEMITFNHGMDALPWSPEESFPRDRVWRITAGILQDEVAMYVGPEIADRYFIRLAGDYALLREDHWESFLAAIADEPVMLEAVHTWRNPTELRPGYLLKGRS
jgi:hypothetical protein